MQFVSNVPSTAGAVLFTLLSSQVGVLTSFYFTDFTNNSLPMMFALTTGNVTGHKKRTTASAIHFGRQSVAFSSSANSS
ncbi:hypothetical protein BJX65DRAFT_279453 [Aspergillus insuetus]